MLNVGLFAEDFGHEAFLKTLLERVADQYGASIVVRPFSVRGGHGKAVGELKQYLRGTQSGEVDTPDILVVAIDANCRGYTQARREIVEVTDKFQFSARTVCAIPDPHIERWMLLDSAAFKEVLGKGCQAPDYKCDRDRYKQLLLAAIREAGISPLVGGMEFAEDIVKAMDLHRVRQLDVSFDKLLDDLDDQFKPRQ